LSSDIIKILSDEPHPEYTQDFPKYGEKISSIILNSHPKFSIGIFGGWGIGKTTIMKLIKHRLDEDPNNKNTITIWFEPWKYEKEKHLGVLPLLRTLEISMKNASNRPGKKEIMDGIEKTMFAFAKSLEFNASLDVPTMGSAGVKINADKMIDSLKTEKTTLGNEKVKYFLHVSDHLKAEVENYFSRTGFRMVVFIDDLDRCLPEKALEVLESIKIFFDITGIIFVIGMDPDSMDHLMKAKYGEGSNIDGLGYLQKIIQFPFHVPKWSKSDIKSLIRAGIRKALEDTEIFKVLTNEYIINILSNSVENNPRQLKRFINTLILIQ
jgi:predicted KAP-like P-loop ATPase